MNRDFREVLAAWVIGLLSIMAAALLLTGCAAAYPTESGATFSPVEIALVDQTARFADRLGVKVRGEIMERMDPGLAKLDPTGWYAAGVAYYYRPNVERYVRLVPTPGCQTAANVAAHEVAHAIYPWHAADHWCCTAHMGAVPTYPPPVAGLVCEGVATRCLTK